MNYSTLKSLCENYATSIVVSKELGLSGKRHAIFEEAMRVVLGRSTYENLRKINKEEFLKTREILSFISEIQGVSMVEVLDGKYVVYIEESHSTAAEQIPKEITGKPVQVAIFRVI